ncbi:MAG: hypothetical protein AABX05_02925 [Nanoarchaeota archaeon]
MKKYALPGLLSLELLLGCAESYPQYSGKYYKVDGPYYSDESFRGQYAFPEELDIIHRMELSGDSWLSTMQFSFLAQNGSEAEGIFTSELEGLTKTIISSLPHQDGRQIGSESQKYGNTEAPCSFQYKYFLFLQLTPSQELFKRSYQTVDYRLGDIEDSVLNSAIDENEGITMNLTFTRWLDSGMDYFPGVDCGLPLGPEYRETESVNVTYFAAAEDLDDQTDIRKAGLEDITSNNTTTAFDFFKKIASGIGSKE